MTVFTATVELTKASWHVLRRHPQLMWFPILSLFATFAAFMLLGPLLPTLEDFPLLTMLVILFAVQIVHVFFMVGLTNEALRALRGAPITVSGGLTAACEHVPSIASFAAISSTVGLVTYLAIPVMVQERRGGIPSLRRSGDLFRKTWGETALAEVGARVIAQYAIILLVFLVFLLLDVFGESPFTVLLIVCIAVALVALIGSLEAIYRSALYVFASEGVVPEPFAGAELDAIWRARPADPTADVTDATIVPANDPPNDPTNEPPKDPNDPQSA
jgi:ABC-type multidrug transport system fused ATPase/permease subunit